MLSIISISGSHDLAPPFTSTTITTTITTTIPPLYLCQKDDDEGGDEEGEGDKSREAFPHIPLDIRHLQILPDDIGGLGTTHHTKLVVLLLFCLGWMDALGYIFIWFC